MTRHETDWFSLAAGLLFTTLGIVFAVAAANAWAPDLRVVTSVTLIALGGGGVAASLTASVRQSRARSAAAGIPDSLTPEPDDPAA